MRLFEVVPVQEGSLFHLSEWQECDRQREVVLHEATHTLVVHTSLIYTQVFVGASFATAEEARKKAAVLGGKVVNGGDVWQWAKHLGRSH